MSAPALTLHAITDALDIVREWLSDPEHVEVLAAAGGDLDALPELRDLLDQAELDFTLKAERVALVAQEKGRRAKFIREEIARLEKLAKADESAERGLKNYLLACMTRANVKKVDGTFARPRIQANPPALRSTLTREALMALVDQENAFVSMVRPEPVYSLRGDQVLEAYKAAVEIVGKCPDLGSIDYATKREAWEQAVTKTMRELGVPDGVTVERGAHVRIG